MSLRDALRIPSSEVTDEAVYLDRRRLFAALARAPGLGLAGCSDAAPPPPPLKLVITPEQARTTSMNLASGETPARSQG